MKSCYKAQGTISNHLWWNMMEDNMRKRMCVFGSSCCGSAETNLTSFHEDAGSVPGLTQWVWDLALPLQWPGLLLSHGFDSWPRNFHMLRVWQKRNEKKRKKEKEVYTRLDVFCLLLHIHQIPDSWEKSQRSSKKGRELRTGYLSTVSLPESNYLD